MVKLCSVDYPIKNEEKYKEYFDMFTYELSPFQKHSIEAIVEGHHVLVTAPTGSGKTLPAEFAIQHFVNNGKKVIYCSPIKALSNQKFYEFTKKYPSISFGLFTGDVKCNPDADVIIMTTEILMNQLFVMESDVIKKTTELTFNINIQTELGCVIFDEVHYINDAERGQTWEKTILMLPNHVSMVMLSATIDNPQGFAEWCQRGDNNSQKEVYLASTSHRIVPLSHYSFLTTIESIFKGMKDKELEKQIRDNTNKLLLLQDDKGKFNESTVLNLQKIQKLIDTKQIIMKRQHVLNNLALHLRDHEMLPAIAFVFSRKHVELCAKEITVPLLEDDSKVGYTVRRECEQIIRKLPNFHEYLELPEYNQVVSLLEKGIGIHHSGMIPVLREIVELMISKKYIKLLFATESFAIGLDCPIRTAVFTSLTKFDGNGERYLMPHEYVQMAGRAGRRGLDKIGYVVHLNNLFPIPTMTEYKQILCGKPQQLISKFHINYGLILNLIKNGRTTDFHLFSEKSMIQNELVQHILNQESLMKDLGEKNEKKSMSITMLKTPYDICLRYKELEDSHTKLVNKKRKDAEREMSNIQDTYRSLKQDVLTVRDYLSLLDEIVKENTYLKTIQSYVKMNTYTVCKILFDTGFIQSVEDTEGHYCFTPLGSIASCIAEIHPLIISKLMVENNYFIDFSIKQLVGLFSCFTDIKIPSEERLGSPNCDDKLLKPTINKMKELYLSFQDRELEHGIQTGINYDTAIQFDLINFSMKWCDCDNEMDCKQFIQGDLADKSISIGDFNKAMLKIVTISRELANICEMTGQIDLLHKLTKVEGMILKYVTTSQSLYV
jgi:superfamily II RNA helicase